MAATTSSPRVWPTKQQPPTAAVVCRERNPRRFIANLQAARAKREAEELSAAQEVAAKISGLTVDLTLEVGQGGKAFGAITNQNIHDALTAQGVEVDRRAIELEKPIKSEGEHEVVIKVHPQVEATLKVVVKENA